ncbi:MAG: lytic murein transglycosylase, partial [Rhodospirillaceae bacterium]|nr:lytic murein transglycosylase [Rhodospirillaceae bacterium]
MAASRHHAARRRPGAMLPALSLVAAMMLGGCQSGAQAPNKASGAPRAPAPEPTAASSPAAPGVMIDAAGFANWLDQVKRDAAARGIRGDTLEAAFAEVAPLPRVIELDRRQPEFSQTFARYLKAAVTDRRVRDGRALLARHASLFDALERRYGVPRRFLVAFWGLETNY